MAEAFDFNNLNGLPGAEAVREPLWNHITTNWSGYNPQQQETYRNLWLHWGGPQAQQRWDAWAGATQPTTTAAATTGITNTPPSDPGGVPDQVPTPDAGAATATPLAAPAPAAAPYPAPPQYEGGFTEDDLRLDPGYQFRLREGEKAIRRSAAAGSGVHSGATLKALQRYGQDTASAEFAAARDREIEDFNLARRGYFDERGVRVEDHQLARQAFFDEIGLEDRARGHAYTDRAYADAQQQDMFERYMRLMGFGGAATSYAVQAAMQAGGMYANARQYGVEGLGASRIGARNAQIDAAFGQGDFWNEMLGSLGDIIDLEDLFGG